MRKETQGILKSLPAPPCSLSNRFQLSEILGEEGNDLIRLSIVERTNHNGMGREEWHKKTRSNPKSKHQSEQILNHQKPIREVILNLALKQVQGLRFQDLMRC
jgi:hypothetical protein